MGRIGAHLELRRDRIERAAFEELIAGALHGTQCRLRSLLLGDRGHNALTDLRKRLRRRCAMLEHLEDDEAIIAEQHRSCEFVGAERRLAEHQLLQLRGRAERRAARALHELLRLALLQVELLRECTEIRTRLGELRLQLLLDLPEAISGARAPYLRLELRTRLFEGFPLPCLNLIEADDVIAVLRLHRSSDLAH